MKRLLLILCVLTLLFCLMPATTHASPLVQDDAEENGLSRIGSVIATLGLYAAMMAVLAVGSEVVIDAVRPIFGLKGKASAAEALNDLKIWLPDTLRELGVHSEAQDRIREQIGELHVITAQVEDRADKVQNLLESRFQDALKDLATHSTTFVVDKYWKKYIEPCLRREAPDLDPDQVRGWLETSLTVLEETNIAEMQAHLKSITNVLETVRQQRNALQSPIVRFWRWLRKSLFLLGERLGGKPDSDAPNEYREGDWGRFGKYVVRPILLLPSYLQYAWQWLRNSLPKEDLTVYEHLSRLGEHKRLKPLLTMDEAARCILEEEMQHTSENDLRIVWIRVLSAVVGIGLAVALRIDSIQLLAPVMENAIDAFRGVGADGAVEWYTFEMLLRQVGVVIDFRLVPNALTGLINWFLKLTPGLVLSGLGAAAGSAFWHDQLDRLRSAKQVVSGIAESV
ncbi:MAG TPA: hypothetical protein ENN19_14050 [Chloroflexi bacterium]|nr:hypothetical protein [Chloroflexota bacterium]